MNIRSFFSPIVLIIIGILMNIISAVVTHYFISENNAEIETINQKVQLIETNIDAQWKAKTEMERKKEFIILLLSDKKSLELEASLQDYLIHHLNSLSNYTSKKIYLINDLTIPTLLNLTDQAQINLINNINDQYFDQLELESLKAPLNKHNALLYSIAIFMQLIGLILVLSRDLVRK